MLVLAETLTLNRGEPTDCLDFLGGVLAGGGAESAD